MPQRELTRRESQIAALITQGLGDREIAAELHVARRTVSNHIQNILLKLNARSRAHVAAIAVRMMEVPWSRSDFLRSPRQSLH